jgi:hypothetical protein
MKLSKEEEEEKEEVVVHVQPRTRDSEVSITTRRFQWRSCCFKIDKRVFVFTSQLIISIIILTFSMIQLAGEHGTCEGSAPYLTLISTLIGYWLPSPTIK